VVGERATIGMGVTVYHDVTIGREAVVVNGVDVMQDVPEGAVVKHARIPAVVRARTSETHEPRSTSIGS